jgi:hypothetical protein
VRINFYNISKWILTKCYLIPFIWSNIPYFTTLVASTFFSQLFYVRIGNTDRKNPEFQYSKLSFIRLSAFGSIYSNISNPTWLPELDQTIRIFFKLGLWISLTTFPLGNLQLQFLLVQVSDAYCNVIYRLRVYSHVIELYFITFLFLLTT